MLWPVIPITGAHNRPLIFAWRIYDSLPFFCVLSTFRPSFAWNAYFDLKIKETQYQSIKHGKMKVAKYEGKTTIKTNIETTYQTLSNLDCCLSSRNKACVAKFLIKRFTLNERACENEACRYSYVSFCSDWLSLVILVIIRQ